MELIVRKNCKLYNSDTVQSGELIAKIIFY